MHRFNLRNKVLICFEKMVAVHESQKGRGPCGGSASATAVLEDTLSGHLSALLNLTKSLLYGKSQFDDFSNNKDIILPLRSIETVTSDLKQAIFVTR